MGRLSARWRRLWGIRAGELRQPVRILGRGRVVGAPEWGAHGRGIGLRHGRLRDQRVATAGALASRAAPESVAKLPINLVADDDLDPKVREHAREVLLEVASHAPQPVQHARIVLTVHRDPALERPAVAKASLDVRGRPVRAHVAAGHMVEAIDLLERRLRRNLEELEEFARADRHETGVEQTGKWRHGDIPRERPECFPRPLEERELIRRKTSALSTLTPEQAAREMQALDHDFHLFTDTESGEESVVYRRPDGAIALEQTTPKPGGKPTALRVDPAPAPVMLLEDAIERLNLSGERFVFFVEAQTRRGKLLYRRYDGHYGLIEPETDVASPR
jgi:hypothetical protein